MSENVDPPPGGSKHDFAQLPQELKDCAQWVLHRNKVPFQPNGSPASVIDSKTWSTFIECLKALQSGKFDGLAFVLTDKDPYSGIDQDGCRDPATGEITPTAKAILEEVDSYSEVSTSGTGVHIIARANVPKGRKVKGIEIYSTRRCFVMTGQHLEGTPLTIEDRDDIVNELYDEITAQQGGFGTKTATVDPGEIDWDADPESMKGWLDEKIASDPQFRRTWEHQRPDLNDQSMSSYDLALASQAVRNHGCTDLTKLYLLIRLHREKYGNAKQKKKAMRPDYICRTIGMALAGLEDEEDEEDDAGTTVSLTIKVERGGLAKTTRKAAAALGLWTRANPFNGVYRRGHTLVQPTRVADESELGNRGVERGRLAIVPLNVDGLYFALSEACDWEEYDGRSKACKPTDPPKDVAKALLALATKWRKIPILTGIVEAPVLRPDGSVLDQPGYDAKTGLLFDPGGVEFPPVLDAPTRDESEAALKTLIEALPDFPFADAVSLSVAISGLITPLFRRACPIVPLHAYTSGMMGSGKSELASIPSYIATGRPPTMTGQAESREEKKRLLALLMEGRSIVVYDNIEEELRSSALCIALTSESYSDRVLGVSQMADPKSGATFYVTGNNAVLAGDLTTRGLVCALDPDCERPEQREFKVDLRTEVPIQRAKLVVAAHTIWRGYRTAGEPKPEVPNFRFKAYNRFVRYPLIWLGMADPCDSIRRIEARDPVRAQVGAITTACYDVFGSKPFKIKDAIREAEREAKPGEPEPKIDARARLYEAMHEVCGERGKLSPRAIGKFISKYEERYQNGLRFERAGTAQHTVVWRIKAASKGQSDALGEVVPKAQAKKAGPKIHIKVPGKYKGLTPTNGVGHGSDPDPHPDAGTVSVNGDAANGSASDHAAGASAVHATAEDGAPVLSEQELAELKDQF